MSVLNLAKGGLADVALALVAVLVMVHPPPSVVVTMRHHTGMAFVVNVVSGVHPGVQPLLNLPHVLSGGGVESG